MQHHAGTQQAVHHTLTQKFFTAGKFQRRIDAHQALVPAALHALHVAAFGHSQGDEVGDIVFAALVGIADARQQAGSQIQAHAVHARIDFVRFGPVQRRIVVLGFHDGTHAAVGGTHHTAIGGGIVQLDGGKGQVGPLRSLHEMTHHVLGEQRRIAVDHQHALALPFQRGHGLHQRMARAQLLFLVHEGSVREGGLHHARLMAHHHQHTPVEHGADGFQHVAQHGFAQNGLQYFGFVGMHAGALARGQNKGGCLQHGGSLQKRWEENSPSARKGQADGYEGEGKDVLKKALPSSLAPPFPARKLLLWRISVGMGSRADMRAQVPGGNGFGDRVAMRCRKALLRCGHFNGPQRRARIRKRRPRRAAFAVRDHTGRPEPCRDSFFRIRRSGRPVRHRGRRSGQPDHPGCDR